MNITANIMIYIITILIVVITIMYIRHLHIKSLKIKQQNEFEEELKRFFREM